MDQNKEQSMKGPRIYYIVVTSKIIQHYLKRKKNKGKEKINHSNLNF